MKAYIDANPCPGGYVADVVSSQDYHERGPHARSYRTKTNPRKAEVIAEAKAWAAKNGFEIVPVEEI